MRHYSTSERLRRHIHRLWPATAMFVIAGVLISLSGCAVLAGGAAGAGTGYIAGKAASEDD